MRQSVPVHARPRARMHRPDERDALGDRPQNSEHILTGPGSASTLDGRCSVTRPYPAGPLRKFRVKSFAFQDFAARFRLRNRRPERVDHQVADEVHPVRRRFLRAAGCLARCVPSCTAGRRSGPSGRGSPPPASLRSKLRSPASTCATGTPFLTATRLHASVELTSPTTMTQTGLELVEHRLERFMTSAVWPACEPSRPPGRRPDSGSSRSSNTLILQRLRRSAGRCEPGRHGGRSRARAKRAQQRRHLHEVRPRADDAQNAAATSWATGSCGRPSTCDAASVAPAAAARPRAARAPAPPARAPGSAAR